MAIRVMLFDERGRLAAQGNEDLLARFHDQGGFAWIDICGAQSQVEAAALGPFALNPLAHRDAQRQRHPAKYEAFQDHVFLLMHELTREAVHDRISRHQLGIFASGSFLITRHDLPSESVEKYWDQTAGQQQLPRGGIGQLCYFLLRGLADRYLPLMYDIEQRLGEIEDEIFESSSDDLLSELINYNSQLKKARRAYVYQHGVIQELMGGHDHALLAFDEHELTDLYEHFERLASMANLYQELTSDLINGFISVSAHRTNNIMKLLTIVTAIFLPLSLIAGIYGMNFENMPELRWRYGYFGVLAFMLVFVAGGLAWIRHKKWL